MLVLGVCAEVGAGPCAGARGSARFGVVVACVGSLVAAAASGVASVRGLGFGWLSWRVVCGVSRGGAGAGRAGVRSRRGAGSFLCWWAVVSHVPGWGRGVGCGMLVLGCVMVFPLRGGGTVSRSGGAGGRSWLLLGRCGAAVCGLLVVPLVCFSTWAVRGRRGAGPGVSWGGLCGIGVSQTGGCGCVVLGGVRPPVSGPSGAGSAVHGPRAGCHVSGVHGSVGHGILGVLWPRCGVRGWGVVVCGWGVSSPLWWGGAMGSGVGWVRGRLPAGSGCCSLTVGGSSAVSPCCVPWWPLVGWLRGVFRFYRIHGGTTACWRAAVGCGGGAFVGVVRVVDGGASCVVLGSSSWWSAVAVLGGWSWAWLFLGQCGTCGVGIVWGGGACVWVRGFGLCSLRGSFLCLSLASLFVHVRLLFRVGGCVWLGACGAGRGCGCVPVLVLVWVWVSWGMGGCGAVGSLCVCRPSSGGLRFLERRSGGRRRRVVGAVVAWCLRGRSWLLGSAWVAWPGAGGRVGVFMAWAVWAVGTPLLGVGRLVWVWLVCVGGMGRSVGYMCAEGVVGWVGALWAMQWVVEMLVMPTGGLL